jgi:hypothetical protein
MASEAGTTGAAPEILHPLPGLQFSRNIKIFFSRKIMRKTNGGVYQKKALKLPLEYHNKIRIGKQLNLCD